MRSDFSHLNELWGALIVEGLVRAGVTCFSISPGSRATPLTLATSQQKQARPVIHFDERGAAFYALGHSRATGTPSALICTSGTAAANYFPAIIEASVDCVPLVILTADRPPELRETGANQTIDQSKLFGDYVRWQMDVPCPDEKIPPEFVLTTIDQAVYRAIRPPAGPVHLNFMFREPLAPDKQKRNFNEYLKNIATWMKSSGAYTKYEKTKLRLSRESIKNVAKVFNSSKSGLIVAGKMSTEDAESVVSLAEKTGWPVFPDIASGLRLGSKNKNVVPYFDLLLLAEESRKLNPDTVIHFGSQPVSKRLNQFLDTARPKNYVRISNRPDRLDPHHQVTDRIECQIREFCAALAESVHKSSSSAITNKLLDVSSKVNGVIAEVVGTSQSSRLTEPATARIISQTISKNSALFLASSLPVREMDMYAAPGSHSVPVEYNRGASGIDGTIASAIGYANGLKKPVTLLIGDLAFLHDLNSLALVNESKFPVTIVILNNDGGGIFSFLPVAEIGNAFEKFFGTPHGLSFEKSAGQFGISYFHPKTAGDFKRIYSNTQKKKNSSIIEIATSRKANWELHQKMAHKIKAVLAKS